MTDGQDRWQRLINGLREGDPQVVREFCEQYGASLHEVAEKYVVGALRRRLGPEDVVQSACRTFLRRARDGQFQLADSENLWRLLCAITLAKFREQSRYHLRQKRGLDREVQPARTPGEESTGRFDPADPQPTPAEAVEFADQLRQLLASFDDEEQRVVELKLQEYTNEEIAERLQCSERTVRRTLKRVQARWLRTAEVP
jgi:RNA polymerase sigma factor (sigma-70 family)